MQKTMTGTLIKESLANDLVLDLVKIEKVEVWKAENHAPDQPKYWTAIIFSTDADRFLPELSHCLKEKWYVDLNSPSEKIIVFAHKVIRYRLGDPSGRQQAIGYCREIGIPESQIDWSE
ncbi:MAG: hypothetical protein LLF96_11310 [Eubacteriales bacterium]|nr:hypothetical protein [Eubacteriales bacterium]